MRVALFGSSGTIFIHSYEKFLSNYYDVLVFNNSPDVNFDNGVNYKSKRNVTTKSTFKKLFKYTKVDQKNHFLNMIERKEINSILDSDETRKLCKGIDDFNPDLIVFFWGTTFRKEIKLISKKYEHIPKLLIVNTYPLRTKFSSIHKNPFLEEDRKYFSLFDRLIVTSEDMKSLFHDSKFIPKTGSVDICPDFIFSDKITSDIISNSSKTKSNDKFIFLGNVNFGERSIDDVTKILIDLSESGVDVYLQSGSGLELQYKNIYSFDSFTYSEILAGKLTSYLNEFDGVIYAYNDANKFRYHMSITTRLLLSEDSLLPIYCYGDIPMSLINNDEVNINLYCFNGVCDFHSVKEKAKCSSSHTIDNRKLKLKNILDDMYESN